MYLYDTALKDLCKQRPVAASKVKVAAKIALKYSSDYKMAVHSIESFIRKAAPMDKLCGVYVLGEYIYLYMYICMYIHICIYIYIYL
jgi:hypothetical protein